MGAGLEGIVEGRKVRVGSHQLVYGAGKPEKWAQRALRRAAWRSALSVFVAVDGQTVGAVLLADELRRDTPRAIQALRAVGIARIVMLTGDRAEAAETIGAALDLDAVLADREPADKVDAVASEQRQHPTVMVGDGINDAPALAAANVGIAMGARGASASSEAADVVISSIGSTGFPMRSSSLSAPRRSRCRASSPEWDFRRWLWRSLQWGICRPSLVR